MALPQISLGAVTPVLGAIAIAIPQDRLQTAATAAAAIARRGSDPTGNSSSGEDSGSQGIAASIDFSHAHHES